MNIIQDIATYAFRGSGKYILLLGAILAVMTDLISFAPFIGFFAVLIMMAYFCSVYFQIIETTATGSSEAPAFPETSSILEDLIFPFLKVAGVLLLSFGPWLCWLILSKGEGSELIGLLLVGLGVVYFPMAMLAVVVLGYFGAMGPHIVIPSILKAGSLYWLAVFILMMLYMTQFFIGGIIADTFIVGSVVMAFVGMFTMMTNGRVLGIIYRERREAMNWI